MRRLFRKHREDRKTTLIYRENGKNITEMDETDFLEAGKKIVKLGISEKCHSVGVNFQEN